MKKVLSVLLIMLFSIVLIACEETPNPPAGETDASVAKLALAKGGLNAIIADPTNITNGFQVPGLSNGVTITWESNNPGVVSVGQLAGVFYNIVVNRPEKGQGDATAKLTANLSIKSALSDDMLTDTWSVDLTVKEKVVASITIDTVADLLDLKEPAYDNNYQVTISDMTIIAKSGAEAWATDGTGVVMLFGAGDKVQVGKVYTVSGTIDWYFGIWEIKNITATEQTDATPLDVQPEVIESIQDKIDELVAAGENTYALEEGDDASKGNFEAIYARITGQVFMIPGDTGNYSTYIVDVDYDLEQEWRAGTKQQPADGLLVYYQSGDLAYVRDHVGKTVTMDVVIYTYRSNQQTFAIYYVGGPTGIVADYTDEEAVATAKTALSLPGTVNEAGNLPLITTGAGQTNISWAFKNADDPNNALVNLATGAFTLPAQGTSVSVTLVATISRGDVTDTKEFTVTISNIQIMTVAMARAASGQVTFQATVLGYIADDTILLFDETGFIVAYNNSTDEALFADFGKMIEITGTRGAYQGLQQVTNYTWEVVGDGLDLPEAIDLQSLESWAAADLLPLQGAIISAANLKVSAINSVQYGNVDLTLLDELTGKTIRLFWDSRITNTIGGADFLKALAVGDYVTFENAVLAWPTNGPAITIYNANQVKTGVAPELTEEQKLALDKAALTLPLTATEDLVLPAGPLANGTTITWETSNDAIIAADGTFSAPEEDTVVTLTATLTNGEATDTKEFEVTAIAPVAGEFASDLFISMYVEGAPGNRKAIQIFNGTGAAVDLSIYTIKVAANGGAWSGTPITLTGSLAHGDVYVIRQSADGNWTADQTSNLNFNGDDAVGLFKNDVLIDVFGVQGEDPGAGWSLTGTGDGTDTVDKVVVRIPSTMGPSTTWVRAQWTVALAIPNATTDADVEALLQSFNWAGFPPAE